MKFFQNCTTIDDVKKEYRILSKTFHPDVQGGCLVTMQAINNEYTFAIAKLKAGENLSAEETQSAILEAEAYRNAVEQIIHLEGINIELVGTWLWVTGTKKEDTTQRGILKGAGFFWAKHKVAWFFRTEQYKSRNRSKMTLDQIKNKYGSESVKGKKWHGKSIAA